MKIGKGIKKFLKNNPVDWKMSTIVVLAIVIAGFMMFNQGQTVYYYEYPENYTYSTFFTTFPTTPTTTTTSPTTVTYGTPYTEWILVFGCENKMPGIYKFTITFNTGFETKTLPEFTEVQGDHSYFIFSGVPAGTATINCVDNGPVQIYGGGNLTITVGLNPGTKYYFNFYESGSNYLVMQGHVRWYLLFTYP